MKSRTCRCKVTFIRPYQVVLSLCGGVSQEEEESTDVYIFEYKTIDFNIT